MQRYAAGASMPALTLLASSALLTLLALEVWAAGQTICAGNLPTDGTVITATTTSGFYGGSCRARVIEPADGPMMVICTGQPISEDYEIESITTTPRCECLGEHDNAYVIRRNPDSSEGPGAN